MLLVDVLAPFVVLAAMVAADIDSIPMGPISIPINKPFNFNGIRTFPSRRDQKRWMNLVKGGQGSTSDITNASLADYFSLAYSANIGVGDPPSYCESCQFLPGIISYMFILDNLLIDTGSSNTWLGANNPYNVTKASVKTNDSVVSIVSRGFLA